MKLAAVAVYWVIVSLWFAVLTTIVVSYLRNPAKFDAARTLVIIISIDTVRNLVENGYFGTYFGAQYGIFSSAIADVLGEPQFLILPKIVNVIAASVVLGLMVLRWLPDDLAKRQETEQKIQKTSEALRQEEAHRQRLFESSVDLILITDRKGNIVRVSPSSLSNLGYSPAEMVGKSAVEFIFPDDLESTRMEMRSARMGRHTRNFETRYFHKNGSVLTFAWSGVWSEPEQMHFFVGRDITDKKEVERKLVYLAHFDQLTGLPNRIKLQADLAALFGKAHADTPEPAETAEPRLALALLDLDDFKAINGTLGQTVGDEVLRIIARRLTKAAETESTVYRVGGDEFVVVFRNRADPLALAQAVDGLLQSAAEPVEVGGQRLFVGSSAGVAIAPAGGNTADELIASAGLAVQEAKAAGGRSQRMFVPTLRAQAQARHVLDLELRRAFRDQEFEIFFQPQIRLTDEAIVGAEALLRWRHPEKGIIAPGAFIDALSKNAVSHEVGQWVLQTACAQAMHWYRQGHDKLRIGVNIFPVQFQENILVEDVEKALRLSGLPATSLEIEITENIALRHDDDLLAPLARLLDAGVSLAFDDFGTGYASLSYLQRYPLSRIKIDKSFVQKIESEAGQDAAIVRSIIAMAHNLGLEVTAEGVETPHQADFLRRERCEEAQGFLYGRPVPASEFERLLAGNTASIGAVA